MKFLSAALGMYYDAIDQQDAPPDHGQEAGAAYYYYYYYTKRG
jgi:hypothetical protein